MKTLWSPDLPKDRSFDEHGVDQICHLNTVYIKFQKDIEFSFINTCY
jgi:hypothetical protein